MPTSPTQYHRPTPPNPKSGSVVGSLYMVIACACFALMLVLIKIAGTKFAMHAYELTFWRVLMSVVVLGGHAWMTGRSFATDYPKAHFWRSLAGAVALIISFYVVIHLPLATASTVQNTSALFLGLWSVLLLNQKPTPLIWTSLILGFVGVVLLLKPSVEGDQLFALIVGLMGGAVAGYAYLQVREMSLLGEPAWRIVFYFGVLTSVLAGALAWLHGFTPLSRDNVPYVLGICGFALVAQMFMTYAYQVGLKFLVAALSYLTVVFSVVLGAVIFDEKLDWLTVLGIGLIVAGGVLASKK